MRQTNRTGLLALCTLAVAASAWAGNPGHPGHDKFKSMDANGDGTVSADEHANAAKSMFDRMDADRDGNVTAAEMDGGPKTMGDAAEHPPGQHGAMDRKAHQGGHGMHHGMSAADKIAKMDTNGDGVLSASEHASGAQAKFSEWDTDRSGGLSKQEMDAGHAMMKSDKPAK